jgi:hypothetical protein
MNDKTVIYYTSNREDEEFEQQIRDDLVIKAGALPIISVSQQPIDLGWNICVGDVGHSYLNAFRQLLIGCQLAETPFVVMAEADCLYPPRGYFDFIPTHPNVIYSYDNVWIVRNGKPTYRRKAQTHASVIYGREFLIKLIEESLAGLPQWSRTKVGFPFYQPEHRFAPIHGELAIVNIKTGNGVNGLRTGLMNDELDTLPYWGSATELLGKLCSYDEAVES